MLSGNELVTPTLSPVCLVVRLFQWSIRKSIYLSSRLCGTRECTCAGENELFSPPVESSKHYLMIVNTPPSTFNFTYETKGRGAKLGEFYAEK